jgi:hypothetical protein
MKGVLVKDPKSDNEYTLPHDPNWQQHGGEECIWLTIKERFSVKVRVTDEGIVCDIFARGHEDEGSIGSSYAFDNETICDCPDHPWNTE